jgi:hypothetical protein
MKQVLPSEIKRVESDPPSTHSTPSSLRDPAGARHAGGARPCHTPAKEMNRREMCAAAVLSAIAACTGRPESDREPAADTPASSGGWFGSALDGAYTAGAGTEAGGASGIGGVGGTGGDGPAQNGCSKMAPSGWERRALMRSWLQRCVRFRRERIPPSPELRCIPLPPDRARIRTTMSRSERTKPGSRVSRRTISWCSIPCSGQA